MKKKRMLLFVGILIVSSLLVYFIIGEEMPPPSNWKGIIPGQTQRLNVISILGEPDEIESLSDGTEEFRYYIETSSDFLAENPFYAKYPSYDEIYLKSDTVYLIVEYHSIIRRKYEGIEVVTPEQIFDQYGKPEALAWYNYDPHARALLYCNQGLIITCRREYVVEVMYFKPMSISSCFRTFDSYITKQYQSPLITDFNPGPLDLWGILDEEE